MSGQNVVQVEGVLDLPSVSVDIEGGTAMIGIWSRGDQICSTVVRLDDLRAALSVRPVSYTDDDIISADYIRRADAAYHDGFVSPGNYAAHLDLHRVNTNEASS